MNYLKFTQYAYLMIAIIFIYEAFTKYQQGENYVIQLMIVAVSIFMFFFRRNFGKKFEERNKKP